MIALAKVAGDMGGRYISHIRSEDRWFWAALDEVITIGRVNHMPVQVSHIKLGMLDLWGQADSVIHVLDRARASGVQVTADIYPYTFWQSNLGVLFPKRNFADSVEAAFVLAHVVARRRHHLQQLPATSRVCRKEPRAGRADARHERGSRPARSARGAGWVRVRHRRARNG